MDNHYNSQFSDRGERIREEFAAAAKVKHEPPRPLTREIPPEKEFPVDALGDCLGEAVEAIYRRTQAPRAICAQAVLSVAALAVQAYADVLLPTGVCRPLSLYLITIAESGERKTSADDLALSPVRDHETELRAAYEEAHFSYSCAYAAWKRQHDQTLNNSKLYPDRESKRAALEKLGEQPNAPWYPMRTCNEPTYEGLIRLFDEGWPSIGLFSDEGGQFIGSYAMKKENRLKTATALSNLWDGKNIRRVRGGDGLKILPGRRLSLHLMAQPLVAQQLFGDPLLRDQGLHSRLLAVMPASTQGTRFLSKKDLANFSDFSRVLSSILWRGLPLGKDKGLLPRPLPFSKKAAQLWFEYVDHIEAQLGPNGDRKIINGLANKLPEHAGRFAAELILIDDMESKEIHQDYLARGIKLTEHYAHEHIRIYLSSQINPELRLAQRLLDWFRQSYEANHNDLISLPDIYQFGPGSIRDNATARQAVSHGYLEKLGGPVVVNGVPRREAWRIVG